MYIWWRQSYGFCAVWKRKRPAPSLLVFPLRRRSSKFLQAHRLNTTWWRWRFFFLWVLSRVWLLFYQSFDTAHLLWSSSNSWCFTRDDARTFVPTIPRRRPGERSLWVGTSKSPFTAAVWSFFSPGAPVTSFRSQPISTVIMHCPRFQQDETSSLLDRRRHESHQTYSSDQLVSHLGTSTTLFPDIWTKTARSIEELYSQWKRPKRASSDQQTDEEDTSETGNKNHVGGRALTNA